MGAETARRFLTRTDVEDAARAGRSVTLGPRDVVTDEAAQRARDLEVALVRAGDGTGRASGGTSNGAGSPARLRAAVRAAVVAELGHEPAGLDAALDKVLGPS